MCCILVLYIINTFASQRLVFEEKNELFLFENASNLIHEFFHDDFNNKIYQNVFPQKRGALKC